MQIEGSNIITQKDIAEINSSTTEEQDETATKVVMVIAFLLIVGLIVAAIQSQKKKNKYTYIDEDGDEKSVSLNFTEDDLKEVYEDLEKIPLEI